MYLLPLYRVQLLAVPLTFHDLLSNLVPMLSSFITAHHQQLYACAEVRLNPLFLSGIQSTKRWNKSKSSSNAAFSSFLEYHCRRRSFLTRGSIHAYLYRPRETSFTPAYKVEKDSWIPLCAIHCWKLLQWMLLEGRLSR